MSDSKYFEKLLYSFIFIIFATIFIIYGYGIMPDSGGYINMSSGREPFYPIFLFVLRIFFKNCLSFLPEDAYLYAASFFANLLAAFAVCFATVNIKRLFKLNKIISAIIMLFMFTPYYIDWIVFKTMPYPSSILTESLSIPLYMIYAVILLRYILNHKKSDYIIAVCLSIILSLIRGQMLILNIVTMIAGSFVIISESKNYKSIYKPVLIMAASFLVWALLSRSYVYITKGYFIGNTYGPVTASSGVLLASDEKDAELFQDKEMKELYKSIQQEITKSGYRENLWDSNLFKLARRAQDAHDPVKMKISSIKVREYLAEKGYTGIELAIETDKILSGFMYTVFSSSFKNWIKIYTGYILMGFIRAVSAFRPALSFYALCLYIIAIFLLFACFKKRKTEAALFMTLSLLLTTGFTTSVALVIMPLSRYVIYNLPFFYSALTVCLVSVFKAKN